MKELTFNEIQNISGGDCKCWCKQYQDSITLLDCGWASGTPACNSVCYSRGLIYHNCN